MKIHVIWLGSSN